MLFIKLRKISKYKVVLCRLICLGLFGVPCLGGMPVNCCLNLQQIINGEVNVVWKLNRGDKNNCQDDTDHKVEGKFGITKEGI